jgi:hypothetical protein
MTPGGSSAIRQPRPKRRRRWLRAVAIVALTVIGRLALSTVANLILERVERGNATPYGERIRIDQGSINVSLTGDSGPTLVLLSGLGTAAPGLDFAPLVRELPGYRTVVVEGFGYGYSDTDVRPRTIENMAEELHSVLGKLGMTVHLFRYGSIQYSRKLSIAGTFRKRSPLAGK